MSEAQTHQHVTFDVTGMNCAGCASKVQKVIAAVPGVADVSVNLPLETADVTLVPDMDVGLITTAIQNAGYGGVPREGNALERQQRAAALAEAKEAEQRHTLLLFGFAALFTLPLVLPMLLKPLGLTWHPSPWLELALALPVQVIAGAGFYRNAYKALRSGTATMDVLVALGTSAAFLFSLAMVLRHGDHAHGHLYFEGAAAIITFVLLGRVLEHRARRGTTEALRALVALRPSQARLMRDGAEQIVAIDQVAMNDQVVVHPGERFPVDGRIVSGETEADESLITGESHAVAKRVGDKVIAGSLNGGGLVVFEAVKVGEDTTLARISRMVEAAQIGKAPVQRFVDKLAAVFVPVVIGLAALTFAGWLIAGQGLETALVAAVSVLVIACPCALGLATPAALVAGTGAAARGGILIKDIETLERTADLSLICFDKTGTLTLGRPVVREVVALGDPRAVVQLAASLQQLNEHPLALGVRARAEAEGLAPLSVSDFRSLAGRGVTGTIAGDVVLCGNEALMAENAVAVDALAEAIARLKGEGQSLVLVARAGIVLGVLGLADTLRPEAKQALALLRDAGIGARMISGDSKEAAQLIGAELGLPPDAVLAGVKPEGKVTALRKLAGSESRIGFVGDGVNDAPALAAAHVGMAMGSGADAAVETAGINLMRPDLRLVPAAVDIARRTRAKIRQNLFWAFAYNVIGIPLAAFGLLSPALAGAAMALSSVSVVTNSLLLRRWRAD